MSDGNYNDARRAERAFYDGKREYDRAVKDGAGKDRIRKLWDQLQTLRARYLRYVR